MIEKFLLSEGLEGLDLLTVANRTEVQRHYIPLMQKNLVEWKATAEKLMHN
jgi:hypothetical protein